MLCPYCNTDQASVRATFTSAGATELLGCGHTGRRNPDIGMALSYEFKEVFDAASQNMVKKRIATVDTRALLRLEGDEDWKEPETVEVPALEDYDEPELKIDLEPVTEPVVEEEKPKRRTTKAAVSE